MSKHRQLQLFGLMGCIGSILFGFFSLIHPFTFDPWDTLGNLEKVTSDNFWVLDHIFIFIGITFWLIGMYAGKDSFHHQSTYKSVGSSLFVVSLTIWIVLLTVEIGIIPPLVDAINQHQNENLLTVWFVVFCFGLLAGYFAFIFTWLGVFFYGLAMRSESFPSWFQLWGIYSGILGVLGIVVGLIKIEYVVPILGLTSGPPFIWSVVFLVYLISKNRK